MLKILDKDMDKRKYVRFDHSWIITAAKPFCSDVTIYISISLSHIYAMDKRKSLPLSLVRLV